MNTGNITERAAELARAFDAVFAEPPPADAASPLDVLAIRLGGDPHALRLTQLGGLYARRKIVPVPSALPELLGLVSLRAAIVPVYDLAALLGRTRQGEPRWIAVASATPIALAFEALDGYRRLSPDAVVQRAPGSGPGGASAELVSSAGELRPLIELTALIQSVTARAEQAKRTKGAREDV